MKTKTKKKRKKQNTKYGVVICFRIPKETRIFFTKLSEETNRNKSDLYREAFSEYQKKHKKKGLF